MDRHTLVECVLNVGQRYSIDTKDFGALTLKLIILSVKYVSKTELWKERFPEEYVDWELVNKVVGRNILGGCAEWLALLSFCKWPDIGNHEASMQLDYPPLHVIRSHLKSCNLDSGGSDAWEVACKVFLVMLLQNIPSQNALELMTCELYKRNTREGVMQLLAKQVRARFIHVFSSSTLTVTLCRPSTSSHRHSTRPRSSLFSTSAPWMPSSSSRRLHCARLRARTRSCA